MKTKHLSMYMRIAESVAETSSAKRLKVGAVAVKNNMVIGTGYNALPSGVDGDCEYRQDAPPICLDVFDLEDDKGKYRLITRDTVRHAEANLLLNLAKSTESYVKWLQDEYKRTLKVKLIHHYHSGPEVTEA